MRATPRRGIPDDVPRRHHDRDHAAGPAQGLAAAASSHGRERRGPGALLDRAAAARHPAARRRACAAAACHAPIRTRARSRLRIDTDFEGVIDGCAASRRTGFNSSTWINSRIRRLYRQLFELGYCHTVEVWSGDRLVGGLYGVALGAAFFGESMFSFERDASKIALVHLAARLIHGRVPPARYAVRDRSPAPVRHRRSRTRRVPPPARRGVAHKGGLPATAAGPAGRGGPAHPGARLRPALRPRGRRRRGPPVPRGTAPGHWS